MRPTSRSALATQTPDTPLPLVIARLAWRHLALLVAMDVLIVLAALPALALAVTRYVAAAPLVAALFVGPVWAGTIATTDELIRDRAASLGLLFHNVSRHARTGFSISLVAAAVASLAIVTIEVLAANLRQPWPLVPMFVDGCAATVVVLAQPALFSLATASPLRGVALWKAALGVVASRPSTMAGLLAIAVLTCAAIAISGGPGLLPFLPAVLAIYFSATTSAALRAFSRGAPAGGAIRVS